MKSVICESDLVDSITIQIKLHDEIVFTDKTDATSTILIAIILSKKNDEILILICVYCIVDIFIFDQKFKEVLLLIII
jgi:hypothetical protein